MQNQNVVQFIQRLEERSKNELSKLSIIGKILGKNDDCLVLAIDNGVIEIPSSDISKLVSVGKDDENIVTVDVATPERIEYVRHAVPQKGISFLPPEVNDFTSPAGAICTLTVVLGGSDTATATNGPLADATDDFICICGNDVDCHATSLVLRAN